MNNALQTHAVAQSTDRGIESNLSEREVSVRRALRTLCAIRERCDIDHARHPDSLYLTVHVALGYTDMRWITAAIEVLERSIADRATEAAAATVQARPERELTA